MRRQDHDGIVEKVINNSENGQEVKGQDFQRYCTYESLILF